MTTTKQQSSAPALFLCLFLTLILGTSGARAQTVVAATSFPGAAGADLNGTAATTGGTWGRDTAFPNNLLLDGNGGVYPGGGNVFGTYKLPITSAGTVTLEADVYVAGTLASANGNGLTLDAYDASGQDHGYKGILYYETNAANAHWMQVRVDSASNLPGVGSTATPSLAAGSYYHVQYALAPGSETLRVGPAQTGLTAYPYTGTYTTVSSATDSTYTVGGPVGVGTYSYVAATATGGLHVLNLRATVPAPVRAAASFYVDAAGGSDSNAGTSPGAAWQTLSKASGFNYVPGDRLYLKGGATLPGSLTFPAQPPVLVAGYGAGRPKVSAGANQDGLSVTNYGNCTVSGIDFVGPETPQTITSTSTWTHGVKFSLTAAGAAGNYSGVAVSGCTVTGFDVGITVRSYASASGYLGTAICGDTVHDCPGNGIVVRGIEGNGGGFGTAAITYNHVYNVPGAAYAVDDDTSGIGIVATDLRYSAIDHNLLHDSGGSNSLSAGPGAVVTVNFLYGRVRYNEAYGWKTANADACAFDLDGGSQYSEVAYNYSHGNQGCGLFDCNFAPLVNTGNTFHHNISVNDASSHNGSFQVDGACSKFAVYSNTIVQTKGGVPVIDINDGSSTGAFYDNLFVAKNSALLFWWKATPTGAGPSQFSFLGNDYYSPDNSAVFSTIPGQTNTTTLAGFRGLGYETLNAALTGLTVSPGWTAASDTPPTLGAYSVSGLRLYDIAPTSSLVGAGIPYALLPILYSGNAATPPFEDYHGVPLAAVPDVGAITYPAGGYPVQTAAPAANFLSLTITHNPQNQPLLSWPNDPAATGYKVLRSTDGITYTLIATLPASATTYTDAARPNAVTVYYHVSPAH